MLLEIFSYLSKLLNANFYFAIIGAFIWGVFSMLMSPCHLSTIPLIIGFISKQKPKTIVRAFMLSFVFALAVVISIGAIGIITIFMGRIAGDIGAIGSYLVAVILIITGLYLMEIISLPDFSFFSKVGYKGTGFIAAFILGLLFGIGLGPCTFAYMAPVLAVSFKLSSTNIIAGISLVFSFAIGHSFVIIFAGTFTEIVEKILKWDQQSKKINIVKKIAGILVITGGIYQLVKIFI
ncbi:cytochrome c biogenesis CcdA family protein [Thermoproteota archaeon]